MSQAYKYHFVKYWFVSQLEITASKKKLPKFGQVSHFSSEILNESVNFCVIIVRLGCFFVVECLFLRKTEHYPLKDNLYLVFMMIHKYNTFTDHLHSGGSHCKLMIFTARSWTIWWKRNWIFFVRGKIFTWWINASGQDASNTSQWSHTLNTHCVMLDDPKWVRWSRCWEDTFNWTILYGGSFPNGTPPRKRWQKGKTC